VLVAPRSDPRAQRERQPAPAYLEAISARAERVVASGELDGLRGRAPWFTDVESFEWWPSSGRADVLPGDVDLAALLAEHRAGRPIDAASPAVVDAALARGLAAAAARRRGEFGVWSGNVGERPGLVDGLDRPRSPTSLERYASCPFSFFLGQVLGVDPLDDPTDLEEISGRDTGSLVHLAMERFIAERGIGKSPDEPWSPDDRRRLEEIAAAIADSFVAEGRTGRPLLWGVRWERLRRMLGDILDEDDILRREWRSTPIAVEHAFGFDDDPVVLDLGDGRQVAFRGVIDRIDRTDDGSLLVVDYKTGSRYGYDGLDDDITGRGRKLQLGVYALAARHDQPAGAVDPRYWFAGSGSGTPVLLGRRFDDDAERRFRDVVGTVLDGVVGGRFPANPGEERWDRSRYLHDNCKWCDFDRVCPTTRGWHWQQVRQRPELEAYVRLAEGDDEHDGVEAAT
jgi:RecB family exonuclease